MITSELRVNSSVFYVNAGGTAKRNYVSMSKRTFSLNDLALVKYLRVLKCDSKIGKFKPKRLRVNIKNSKIMIISKNVGKIREEDKFTCTVRQV